MPGHTVATIPIQTHAGGDERFAQLLRIVAGQLGSGPGQDGLGQRFIGAEEAHQSRNIHLAVIHPAPFGLPIDRGHQPAEQLGGAADPKSGNTNPAAPLLRMVRGIRVGSARRPHSVSWSSRLA